MLGCVRRRAPLPRAGRGVPVRAILLRMVLAVTAAAALAAGGIAFAGASIVPGRNGKIVVGQNFPNFGFTINPNGSERDAVGPPGSTTCTGWSPNGGKVLCNVWGQNHVQPATANPDGSGFRLLNPARKLDLFCLSWSPDGRRLLCHSEGMLNPAQAGLYSIRAADGRGLVRITASPSGFSTTGTASPPTALASCTHDSTPTGTACSSRRTVTERGGLG